MLWWTLRRLRSSNVDTRQKALKRLEQTRDPRAVRALVVALRDSEIAADAVRVLAEIDDPLVIPALAAALSSGPSRLKNAALEALGDIGDPAVIDLLFLSLPQLNPSVLAGLIKRIGPAAFERFRAQVQHPDIEAQKYALEILEQIGDPPAIREIIKALDNFALEVKYAAAAALGRLRSHEAIVPIRDRIPKWEEAGYGNSAILIDALVQIGGERAIGVLINELMQEESYFRQSGAGRALHRLGWQPTTEDQRIALALARDHLTWPDAKTLGPDAVRRLMRVLRDGNDDEKGHAISLLGEMKAQEAVDTLLKLLGDHVGFVQNEAAKALGAVGDRRAFDGLIAYLDGATGSGTVEAAVIGLGRLGDPRAFGPILAFLANENIHWELRALVSRSAAAALEGILSHHASDIPDSDLETILGLGDKLEEGEMRWQGDMSYTKTTTLDISALRQAATDELARRRASIS